MPIPSGRKKIDFFFLVNIISYIIFSKKTNQTKTKQHNIRQAHFQPPKRKDAEEKYMHMLKGLCRFSFIILFCFTPQSVNSVPYITTVKLLTFFGLDTARIKMYLKEYCCKSICLCSILMIPIQHFHSTMQDILLILQKK